MNVNPHSILPIICFILSVFIGVFVLSRKATSPINQSFFAICFAFALWQSFYIPYNIKISPELLLYWFRISHCGIIFIGITCFIYTTIFLDIKAVKKWQWINALIGLIFCLINLYSNLIVSGFSQHYWGNYPLAGSLHPIYLCHLVVLFISTIYILINYIKTTCNSKKRNQAKYILVGFIILSLSSLDFITNYGGSYYPLGYLPTTAFLLIIAYAIIKHQLMDIKIIIRKSLVYSTLITLITIIYFLSIYLLEHLFKEIFGYKSLLISLLFATTITLIIIPLKNMIQNFFEKYLFQGSFVEIARQNELLRQEVLQTERLKSVAILASGMAHEIKNPLTVLKTFTEYLPKNLENKEFLKKYSPMVAQEVDRIDNLVHELLDFAKPAPAILKPENLYHVLDSTIEFLSSEYLKHKIKVIKNYETARHLTLNLDHNQIRQALLNILLNSIDAMKNGGQLSIETSVQNENKINIKIHDTGIGIDKQDLEHIFDPFFTKKDGGTGLGLSITHEIIRKHNGRIFVESVVGQGSVFILELPLLKARLS